MKIKRFLVLILAVLMLFATACNKTDSTPDKGDGSNWDATNKENGGLKNSSISLNEGEVVFRGKVTSINKKEIQMEILDIEIAFGIYRVLYNSETPFFGLDGQQITLSDIEIGDVIEVVFSGQVMMSYPPQIVAVKIAVK